jgi:hypothetical protein
MRRITITGLTLAVFTLAAVATTAATAELGFLPLTKKGATIEGGVSTLETASGGIISCLTLDPTSLTFVGDKHFTGTLHWLHCLLMGFPINSLGDGSGEVLEATLLLACLTNSASLTFGVAAEVSKAHLEVPSLGILMFVNGSVLGLILRKAGEKATSASVDFEGSKGVQVVKECSDSSGTKKQSLTVELNENKKTEAVSQNIEKGTLKFEETLELMDT